LLIIFWFCYELKGELGNFEVIELTESEMEDIIGEGGADGEIIYEEDGDYQGNHQQDDL